MFKERSDFRGLISAWISTSQPLGTLNGFMKAQDIPGLEDVLPASSIHEVRTATSWLLRMGTKSREPAIILGQLKFTYGHCFIVPLVRD